MADPPVPIGFVCADPMWRIDFLATRPNIEATPLPTMREAVERYADVAVVLFRIADPTDVDAVAQLLVAQPRLVVVGLADDVSIELLRAAMTAGLFMVLPADVDEATLVRALDDADERARLVSVQRKVGPAVATTAGWLVVVTSAKGGQGASTVATNLALTLHAGGGRRVILVDGDVRFGDVGGLLGFVRDVSVPFVPAELPDAPDWFADVLWRHVPSGLVTVLPPRLQSIPDELPRDAALRALGATQVLADIVVVDLPFSTLDYAHVETWADSILLVTTDRPRDLVNAQIAAKQFKDICPTSGLVVSTYRNGRTPKRKTLAADIGIGVYGRIPEQADAGQRVDEGRPVVLDDPSGAAAAAYADLATRLLDELSTAPTSPI
jgi:pilus assembly protein CpaE